MKPMRLGMRIGGWLLGVGLGLMLGAGCGGGDRTAEGEETAGGATNRGGAGNPLTAPVDYIGAVGAAHRQAGSTVDTLSLQQGVRAFEAGEGRRPASLEELISEGYLPRLPVAPRGQRWTYDAGTGRVGVQPSAN